MRSREVHGIQTLTSLRAFITFIPILMPTEKEGEMNGVLFRREAHALL